MVTKSMEVERGDGARQKLKSPITRGNFLKYSGALNHGKFSVNLSGRYQDGMRTVAGQGEMPTSESTDAFLLLDANVNYRLRPKVSVFGSVANLTDQVAVVSRNPAGLRPNLPRTMMVGLKVNF